MSHFSASVSPSEQWDGWCSSVVLTPSYGDFIFEAKWSNRDWIYPPTWNDQNPQNYETMVYKTLDIRQWRRDEKQMKWVLQWSWLPALRDFSGHGTGRRNPGGAQWCPELRLQMTMMAGVRRIQHLRGEHGPEREIWSVPRVLLPSWGPFNSRLRAAGVLPKKS